jgi:hypothetical protein
MVTNMKAVGLFSWLKGCEPTFFEEALKLGLLWFDDLVMQSPRGDLVTDGFPKILEKLGVRDQTAAEISRVIHPVQEFLPEYTFADPEVWSRDSHVSEATHVALEKYFEEHDGPWPEKWALMREVALTGCGVIDALYLVAQLSQHFDCFMLPTDFEHAVLAELTKPSDSRSAFELFSEVAQYRLPKLRDLGWERIVELRHHRFLLNFRRALSELQIELRRVPTHEVRPMFDEIERRHIKELLSLLEPSTLESCVKGIVTNLPLPIPVNPVGVYDAIQTVRRNRMLANKYGWLYFLYELT